MRCPELVNMEETFGCNLTALTYGVLYNISVHFADGDSRLFEINDSSLSFEKYYNFSGNYTIQSTIYNKEYLTKINGILFVLCLFS